MLCLAFFGNVTPYAVSGSCRGCQELKEKTTIIIFCLSLRKQVLLNLLTKCNPNVMTPVQQAEHCCVGVLRNKLG